MTTALKTTIHTSICNFILISFLLISSSIESSGQNNSNWISNFSQDHQNELQLLENKLSSIDSEINSITGTLDLASIKSTLENISSYHLLHKSLEDKKSTNTKIISIYESYIISSKSKIDLLNEYSSSAQNNINTIDQQKKLLIQLEESLIYSNDSLEKTKNLIEVIKSQEDIVFNSKQYFTLFALSNNGTLLSKSDKTTPKKPIERYSGPSTIANVIVNEEIVESIQIALENYEEDTTDDLYIITTYDIENILAAWDEHIYPTETINEPIDKITDNTTDSASYTSDNIKTPVENEDKYTNTTTVTKTEDKIVSTTKVTHSQPTSYTDNIPQQSNELIFRVQVAASRVPLITTELNSIYTGPLQIKMFQEEGWYKYYIADCNTLKEAIIIKKESGVNDAFVMAYKNGVKVKYYLKYTQIEKGSSPPANFIDLKSLSLNKLVVVIQFAAKREPMTDQELKEKYTGNIPVNYIYEEGWHKYSYGNFEGFWPANHERRRCGIKGAFIVAYKNGTKFNLWAENGKD